MIKQIQIKSTGITIIVGLEILAGIISLVMILYLLTLSYFPGNALTFFVAFGMVSLLLASGLWRGKRWARIVTLVLSLIGIVFWISNLLEITTITPSTFWGSIFNIILYAALIFYLTRPPVKAFFE